MQKLSHNTAPDLAASVVRAGMIISAAAAIALLVLAVMSVTHSEQAFAMVQTHFAEPASTYPAESVATLILMVALLASLAWLFLRQVQAVHKAAQRGAFLSEPVAHKFTVMAGLMLAIEMARYPIANVALDVETAFKGPTSEVAAGAPVPGLLAAIALFAVGSAIRQAVNSEGGSA